MIYAKKTGMCEVLCQWCGNMGYRCLMRAKQREPIAVAPGGGSAFRIPHSAFLLHVAAILVAGGLTRAAGVLPAVAAKGSYVVVVSSETAGQPEWMAVVQTLRAKHDAALIVYPSNRVVEMLPALKALHPRFAAFVARPEEAGRMFVVAIHRLTRKLDDDPYTDLRWGIVTGYEAADALRVAKRTEPLVIETVASSMGPGGLEHRKGGFASAETVPTNFWYKVDGGEIVKKSVAPDAMGAMANAFNTIPPDAFVTSGHATEHDWQAGYNVRGGQFRHKDGQLFALSTQNKRYDITSPHPKVYLPMGNCLIGHISGKDCMATAWMHSGGVHQMFGYTVVTFHGFMGWGIGSYLNESYNLSDAFFFNNQALVRELQVLFPAQAGIEIDDFDMRNLNGIAQRYRIADRKLFGHLWDRDTVAFYGDPAWEVRYPANDPAWEATYSRDGERVRIVVKVLKEGSWGNRPLAVSFPERLTNIRDMQCSHGLEPVVTDDFALLPVMEQPRQVGDLIVLTFGADTAPVVATSAAVAPVEVAIPKP